MLVLSRKVNEKIRIEGPCTITLVRLGPESARIGIEADGSVNIRREELPERPEDVEARASRKPVEHTEKEG